MKNIVRTLIVHLLCIILFTFIYYNLGSSFYDAKDFKKDKTLIDYFALSVTIQSTVGLTYLEPTTYYSKLAILLQQLCLISIHVITLYVFTL